MHSHWAKAKICTWAHWISQKTVRKRHVAFGLHSHNFNALLILIILAHSWGEWPWELEVAMPLWTGAPHPCLTQNSARTSGSRNRTTKNTLHCVSMIQSFYWRESESESNVVSRWVHRKSNLMLTLSNSNIKEKIRFRVRFCIHCKWNLKPLRSLLWMVTSFGDHEMYGDMKH